MKYFFIINFIFTAETQSNKNLSILKKLEAALNPLFRFGLPLLANSKFASLK